MSYPLDIGRIQTRQLFTDRMATLARSYVGQRIIDEGAESVYEFTLSSIESTLANETLRRIGSMLFYHGVTNARNEGGASPGSHDNLIIPCGLVAGESSRRWVINLGWDEVMVPQESDDYFIRVTFGAGSEDLDGCNPSFECEWVTLPLTLNATHDDILDVCEAIVRYITSNGIPLSEAL